MRRTPIVAGIIAGALAGLAGIGAIDLASPSAQAQPDPRFATEADLKAANSRASAAINIGKRIWNLLGIYVAEDGEIVGAKSGPITQRRGVGGGIPPSLLAAGSGGEGVPGPAGSAGPAGPAGPPGPPGPTDGVSVVRNAPNPFPVQELLLGLTDVTTPSTGRLYLSMSGSVAMACNGADRVGVWLRLDGQAIESSYRMISDRAGEPEASVEVGGVTDEQVAAGEHSLTVAFACAGGSWDGSQTSSPAWQATAIVLG